MELVIGNKDWSTWSLRAWLVLKHAGVAFSEVPVRLRLESTSAEIAALSPSGKAPALRDGDLTVWDSLAISEYLADRFPEARLWPTDPVARALARAAACEMHSGFASLRGECPMEISVVKSEIELSEATHHDIRRIVALWNDLRSRFGQAGPWLVGEWSIADAFFAPVATRFRTYGVSLDNYGDGGAAAAYAAMLLADPAFREWEAGALAEAESAEG